MPAESKKQQRLFGIAHAIQTGKMKASEAGGAAKKIAKTVSKKSVKDFASTKTKELPKEASLNIDAYLAGYLNKQAIDGTELGKNTLNMTNQASAQISKSMSAPTIFHNETVKKPEIPAVGAQFTKMPKPTMNTLDPIVTSTAQPPKTSKSATSMT